MAEWYSSLKPYNKDLYIAEYDPSLGLFAGDISNGLLSPYSSTILGENVGRYKPTPGFGLLGEKKAHWNKAKEIEKNNYYTNFTDFMLKNWDTEIGKLYRDLYDKLLPPNLGFNNNSNFLVKGTDAQGHYFNLVLYDPKERYSHLRYDGTIGAIHNIGAKRGKRYFYKDDSGQIIYVDPNDINGYNVTSTPVKSEWEGDTLWDDYELTGSKTYNNWFADPQNEFKFNYPEPSKNTPPSNTTESNQIQGASAFKTPVLDTTLKGDTTNLVEGTTKVIPDPGDLKSGFDWKGIGEGILKIFGNPNLLGFGRLAGTLINNEKIYDEALKGINPTLKLSYHTHRQIVGDEATKQAYYRRAAQGLTKAAQAFTSDADRLMTYLMEAKRAADELRAQGDLADNQEIRRTSDESNLHEWANTQRDTEIANYNIAALLQADSLRHNLLAQKHSALWSSIDNYLKTIETRRRLKLEEFDALRDLEFTLAELDYIYSPEYLSEYNKYKAARKNAIDPTTNLLRTSGQEYDNYVEAQKRWGNFLLRYRKGLLERLKLYKMTGAIPDVSLYDWSWINSLKSGGKVTHKKKDDLLYKSTRDVVEHFRKMSKLSSDALNRKKPKIEKLTDHPKTKKYELGGVAPFNVWTPAVSGGETTRESSSSSKKSSSEKDESLDLLKELFKMLNVEGLPSDTNIMYGQVMQFLSERNRLGFGNDISTDDMATLYVTMLQRISNIKFNKLQYDEALKIINSKNASGELAVNQFGQVAIQNRETKKIEYKSPDDIDKEVDIPLTNGDLLQHRSFNPNLAFDLGTVLSVASNATSMTEIAKFLKENLPKIEKSITEQYNSQQAGYLHEGINLLKDAPEGIYKAKSTTQINQAKAALLYLYGVLPPLMLNFLVANGKLRGVDPTLLLTSLISSNIGESVEFDAVKDNNEDGDINSLKINSAVLLLLGMSSPREFTFDIGNGNSFLGFARVSSINDTNETPFGADFSYSEIYKSSLRKNLDLDNASFGDVPINKALKDRIIVDNSTIAGIDLPYRVDSNGRIIPDFLMLLRIEEADKDIMRRGIDPDKEPEKVNKVYTEHLLPIKYNSNNQLTSNYKRFAVILATAIEDVFLNKSGLSSNGTLTLVSDENELNKYIAEVLKITGKEIDMDRDGIWTGDKDIYKGSIFIPIIGDLTDAISGGKGNLTAKNYDSYRSRWETKNYVKPQEENFSE